MSLSRRMFTKEFKEAALRRLELRASIAEVARACEVNPNLLHRYSHKPTIITFDPPGAGTGAGQGTVAGTIDPAGEILAWYFDASGTLHGFMRTP
jgi:hypothetical protein